MTRNDGSASTEVVTLHVAGPRVTGESGLCWQRDGGKKTLPR